MTIVTLQRRLTHGGWNESFLDWLMETINYDKPGYNDVLEVEIIGDSVSHSVLVVIH